MESFFLTFGSTKLELHTVLLSFLFAFALSSILAIVYERTFRGLSWSRGLVQSMILGSIVSCLLMISIGDNIARGIGIVGSLAIIRFRTNLRDPKDLIFIFAALGAGVSAGVQSYMAGTIGVAMIGLLSLSMEWSSFATRRQHDGLVRFQAPNQPEVMKAITEILATVPSSFALVTLRDVAQGTYIDCAYQVKFRHEGDSLKLVDRLKDIQDIRGLSYLNQENTIEV